MSTRVFARVRLFLLGVALTTIYGVLDAYLFSVDDFDVAPNILEQIGFSWFVGSVLFWGFEILVVPSRWGEAIRRMHFVAAILLKSLFLLVVIFAAAVLGDLVFRGTATLDVVLSPDRQFGRTVVLVFLFVVVFQVVLQVVRMVGARNFLNFVLGRYRQPVSEDRIFMFLDLAGSTTLAERLGDVGVQRLITEFFFDISEPIAAHGGEIHQYVGDEMVVTWRVRDGKLNRRVLHCCFAIAARVREKADAYERAFGVVPGYRIGLHAGSIVISQCGDQKQEISFFGDTINTAARIQEQCKAFACTLLLSRELLKRIDLPETLVARQVGTVTLRGRGHATDLFSVDPR
ncbi:adenylate/guanylate cyclase domain-containing protein [Ovoidimarina sediminis]|uniref:adenylate/guanylate cyclase domain-containing protein n=1 Tax=Ovoidimarina sediminis TaxID=3079856 RepID=UPI002910A3B0|nr:adenylate/guanylate cyclase domain-containing protein [Rhodophyticola sp. MJ-SS7]MDU8943972.1 adenylate/guanylate cyclase domain-containing protein [Rhodophyticola sp. MJ-SS7]